MRTFQCRMCPSAGTVRPGFSGLSNWLPPQFSVTLTTGGPVRAAQVSCTDHQTRLVALARTFWVLHYTGRSR